MRWIQQKKCWIAENVTSTYTKKRKVVSRLVLFTFGSRQSRSHLIKEIKIMTLRTIEGARRGERGRTSLLFSFLSLHFVCYSLCSIRLNWTIKSRIVWTLIISSRKYMGKSATRCTFILYIDFVIFFFGKLTLLFNMFNLCFSGLPLKEYLRTCFKF